MVIKMSQLAHFFVFTADGNKNPVTVWAKYLSASKRTHLTLLESTMDQWVLSYHLQDDNPSEYKILVFFTDSAVFLIFLLSVSHEW